MKKIFQDSKGKLYFLTLSGLSIYDGVRFTNFTKADGLGADVVNDAIEMGDDSVWIASNSPVLNYISKGTVKKIKLIDGFYPIINSFCKTDQGKLFIAADQGLYSFSGNRFVKMPLFENYTDSNSQFLNHILAVENYLLIITDISTGQNRGRIYLYNIKEQRITETLVGLSPFSFQDNGSDIWLSTADGIKIIDKLQLGQGKIVFKALPPKYKVLENKKPIALFFDRQKNLWTSEKSGIIRIDSTGGIKEFTAVNGLDNNRVSDIFEDREGTLWFITENYGIQKLINTNIELITQPFNSAVNTIATTVSGDSVFYYSESTKKIILQTGTGFKTTSVINTDNRINNITVAGNLIYLNSTNHVYSFPSGKLNDPAIKPLLIYTDTSNQLYGSIVDANGVITFLGSDYLTSIVRQTKIYQQKIKYYPDEAALDSKGRLWFASRADELYVMQPSPDNPDNYLQLIHDFSTDVKIPSPRAVTIDKADNVWIGTRESGLYCFAVNEKLQLTLLKHITKKEGLTENFITWLYCDKAGTIWSGTSSGLDKITVTRDNYIIENITQSANLYPYISKIVENKENNILAVTQNASLLKIGTASKNTFSFTPEFFIVSIKAGDSIFQHANAVQQFTYKENNIIFKVASPSFYDEKKINYSYILEGSGNNNWSEPTHNAEINLINLSPGKYNLKIKADYPGAKYPSKIIAYFFKITPPWWQTWWCRLLESFIAVGLLALLFRTYYRKKLERQKIILEKHQIVEKERTRIAEDIHDDLGAGLSSIRFLSEKVKRNSSNDVTKKDTEKIAAYSNELVQKMNELIWAMNEKNDTLEDLLFYTRSYVAEYAEENNLQLNVHMPEIIPPATISGEVRRNVFLTVKEAIHNIVKHAQAEKVFINVSIDKNLLLGIKDDGIGFPEKNKREGNGLKNMQKRIQSVGGTLEIKSENGVEIKISLPLTSFKKT
ncbi:MAG: two-component regulator propeller domain-containing protein [Ferruginibacter sp.]